MQDSQRTVRADWQVGHVVAPDETNVSHTAQHVPRPSALSGSGEPRPRRRPPPPRRRPPLPPRRRAAARARLQPRQDRRVAHAARAGRAQRRPRALDVPGQQRVDHAVAELVVEPRQVRRGVALEQQLARVREQVVGQRALAVGPAAAVDLADLLDPRREHLAGRARGQAEEREQVRAQVGVVAQPRQLGQRGADLAAAAVAAGRRGLRAFGGGRRRRTGLLEPPPQRRPGGGVEQRGLDPRPLAEHGLGDRGLARPRALLEQEPARRLQLLGDLRVVVGFARHVREPEQILDLRGTGVAQGREDGLAVRGPVEAHSLFLSRFTALRSASTSAALIACPVSTTSLSGSSRATWCAVTVRMPSPPIDIRIVISVPRG